MSTSKLQIAVGDLLDKVFPQFHIHENYRPDWLISSNFTKLELDFFIDELKVAIEIQGQQHFEYIPLFHGDRNGFELRKKYDLEKKDLCLGAGIKLLEIITLTDAHIIISDLVNEIDADKPIELLPKRLRDIEIIGPKMNFKRPPKKKQKAINVPSERDLDLEKWKRKSIKRLKMNKTAACQFQSDCISVELADKIFKKLTLAKTLVDICSIFEH